MKILIISRAFPPMIGGISYSLRSFYESFKINNHKLSIFIFPYSFKSKIEFPKEILNVLSFKKFNFKFFFKIIKDLFLFFRDILKENDSFRKKLNTIYYLLRYFYVFYYMMNFYEIMVYYDEIYNYDFILAYRSDFCAVIGYLLKKKTNKKLFIIVHGMEIFKKNLLLKIVLNKVDGVIVRSNYVKNLLINTYNTNENLISICTDGITPDKYKLKKEKNTLREELKLSKNDFYILSVGALYPVRKGFDLVLKSLKELRDRFNINISGIKYVLIGRDSPKVRNWLINLANKYNLRKNFKLLVNLEDDLRNKYYKASDIFVMPSKNLARKGNFEGFGNVFIEAGYYFLPSIGSNSGGIPDAIEDGKSGFLVNNFNELVEKIKILYENKTLRLNMGQYAHKRAIEKFSWKNIYLAYLNAFKKDL